MSRDQAPSGLEVVFYLAHKALGESELTGDDLGFLVAHPDYVAVLRQAATLVEVLSGGGSDKEEQQPAKDEELQRFFLLAYAALRPSELDDTQLTFLKEHRQWVRYLSEAADIIEELVKFGTGEPVAQSVAGLVTAGVGGGGDEV